jgi:hypothetical protein
MHLSHSTNYAVSSFERENKDLYFDGNVFLLLPNQCSRAYWAHLLPVPLFYQWGPDIALHAQQENLSSQVPTAGCADVSNSCTVSSQDAWVPDTPSLLGSRNFDVSV